MKHTKPRITVIPPPDDGREWILADDAATLFSVTRTHILALARRFNWTRSKQSGKQTYLLKSDVLWWHNFVKDRRYWYKRRRPKTWQPMFSIEPKNAEADFPRYWWTSMQAAEFMGVSRGMIYKWTKQGKIPVFTTGKLGQGHKYWYSPTSLRNLKESEEWQKGRVIHEKTKAAMRQGIVDREVYTTRHRPYIYQGIPPGWITMREVAERLQISRSAAHRLRRMERFMSRQFVGEWDKKCRPWFCDEDGVERLKNDEEYQKACQRGRNAVQTIIGKPALPDPAAAPNASQQLSQRGDHMMPDKLTFGYTREDLQLGASLTIEW